MGNDDSKPINQFSKTKSSHKTNHPDTCNCWTCANRRIHTNRPGINTTVTSTSHNSTTMDNEDLQICAHSGARKNVCSCIVCVSQRRRNVPSVPLKPTAPTPPSFGTPVTTANKSSTNATPQQSSASSNNASSASNSLEKCPITREPKNRCKCNFCFMERQYNSINSPKPSAPEASITIKPVHFVKAENTDEKTDVSCQNVKHLQENLAAISLEKDSGLYATKSIKAPEWMHKYVLENDDVKQMSACYGNILVYTDKQDIKVEGKSEHMEKFVSLIDSLIANHIPNKYTMQELKIEKKYYKFIIGKEGSTLKKLRSDTDTEIEVPGRNSKIANIKIYGTKENVTRAVETIINIIEKNSSKVDFLQDKMYIKQMYHKILIGNKGVAIQNICKRTGADIHFPKEHEKSDIVFIKGTLEQITKAKEELLKSVEDIEKSRGIQPSKSTENLLKEPVNLNYEVEQLLQCKICTKLMKPPIYMCVKGHNLCEFCKIQNEKCSCGNAIGTTRNFHMEKISEKVKSSCEHKSFGCEFEGNRFELDSHYLSGCRFEPKYFCIYKSSGCPFKSFTQSTITDHEKLCLFLPKLPCEFTKYGCRYVDSPEKIKTHRKNCSFRTISCPMLNPEKCVWAGTYSDLKRHAKDNHNVVLNCVIEKKTFEKDLNGNSKDSFLVMIYDEVFKVGFHLTDAKSPLNCCIACLNPMHLDAKYKFQLEFVDQANRGFTFIITETCNPFKSANADSLSIPRKLLAPYTTPNKSVWFKLDITKIEINS